MKTRMKSKMNAITTRAERLAPRLFGRRMQPLPSGRYISLCFDDFPKSAAWAGADALEARGLRATYYVSGGFMDTVHDEEGAMFSGAELARVVGAGHELGCHTYSHLNCADASEAEIESDLALNRIFFDTHGLPNPKSFALPYGETSLQGKRTLARRHSYVRGVHPGKQEGAVDTACLRARGIEGGAEGVQHALDDIADLASRDGWLILFTHDVREDAGNWGCTPAQWAQILDAAIASGAEIAPVGVIADKITDLYSAGTAQSA